MSQSINQGQRVYTCGHSFHVWVAPMLAEIAASAGIEGHVMAGLSSIGGSSVIQHWNEQGEVHQALSAGSVDVLTLSPIWMPDAGIKRFAHLAAEHRTTVRVTIQLFWLPNDCYEPVYPLDTKKTVDHDATDLELLAQSQGAYDHDVDEVVQGLNQQIGRTVLVVVPVGQAVLALRQRLKAGEVPGVTTQKSLFMDSWGHPGTVVKVLAVYCHFAVIYRQSPQGLPTPSQLTGFSNAAALNALLQDLAWNAVIKHPLSGFGARVPRRPEAGDR
jgi:hypothetical protein